MPTAASENDRLRGVIAAAFVPVALAFGAFVFAASRGTVIAALCLGVVAALFVVVAGRIHNLSVKQHVATTCIVVGAVALLASTKVLDSPQNWWLVVEDNVRQLTFATMRSLLLAIISLAIAYGLTWCALAIVFVCDLWERVPITVAWIAQALPIVFLCAFIDGVVVAQSPLATQLKIIVACAALFLFPPLSFVFGALRRQPTEQMDQLHLWNAGGWARLQLYAPLLNVEIMRGMKISAAWAIGGELVAEYYFATGWPLGESQIPLLASLFKQLGKNEAGGLFVVVVFAVAAASVVWGIVERLHHRLERTLFPSATAMHA